MRNTCVAINKVPPNMSKMAVLLLLLNTYKHTVLCFHLNRAAVNGCFALLASFAFQCHVILTLPTDAGLNSNSPI